MLVLSARPSEKILLSDANTSIEVVAIQSGSVRLGIRAPEAMRILRESTASRDADWSPPSAEPAPSLPMLRRLLEKRLEIARSGLDAAQQMLRAGNEEDARLLLEKVDEDLHLLKRRIRREFEKAEMTCGV